MNSGNRILSVRKAAALIVALATLSLADTAWSAADDEELDAIGHTADGVYLDFAPFARIELPRIFFVRRADGGFGVDVFGSTSAAVASGSYSPEPEILTTLTLDELVASGGHVYVPIYPVEGALLIDFSITRHLVYAFLVGLLLLFFFTRLAKRYQRGTGLTSAPKGVWQNMLEVLIIFVRDEIAKPNIGPKYKRFLPYLLTAFFFILLCNLLGMVPFGATPTANLTVTAALATCTFVITQFSGSRDYWRHIFWPPGMPVFVKIILIPVELMGMISKPVALAIRLFAVMTAGHLVILSLIGLIFTFALLFNDVMAWGVSPISVLMALFVTALELLIAVIQAYIFTILSALFIGMAVAEHHEEHHPEKADLDRHIEVIANTGVTGDGAAEQVLSEPAAAR